MGGVPAVKIVRESLVGDEIQSIAGILNGTCNYILTEMEATGRSFADVLAEAQRLVKQGLSLSTTNTPQRANLLVLDGDLSLSRGDSASAARSWAEARALNDAR